MNIGILTTVTKHGGGVYQYTLSLLEALRNYSGGELKFSQITSDSFPKILENCIIINNTKSTFSMRFKRLLFTLTGFKIGDILGSYRDQRIKQLDLIISPIISLVPCYVGKPFIITIHDFQQEYYPQFFTLKERLIRKIVYKSAQKANLVVCESDHVKSDLKKFLGVKDEKIRVLPSPPPSYIGKINLEEGNLLLIKKKYDLPEKYLFYPAQFWYHKNHLKLLQSLSVIKDRFKQNVNLILVGAKQNNFQNTMSEIKRLRLTQNVKYLGYVPEEDMPYLYKLSTALVMPTLFESVSIPIWEAFYLGVPVVASNVCALPEQVGDAGLLFDPNNIEDMAEKIHRLWTDDVLRQNLIKKGYKRIENLTLEKYAESWKELIEEVIRKL